MANTTEEKGEKGYPSDLFCTNPEHHLLKHDGKGGYYCDFCLYEEDAKLHQKVIICGKTFIFKPSKTVNDTNIIYDLNSEMPIAIYNFKTKKVIRWISCDYELTDGLNDG